MQIEKLYTVEETAQILQVEPWMIRNLVHAGRLKVIKMGGGKFGKPWKISESTIKKFIGDSGEQSR